MKQGLRPKGVCLIVLFLLFVRFTPISAQKLQPDEGKYERASLRLVGDPTDSTITIHYAIRDSAHVCLDVLDSFGEIIANPIYSSRSPGSDSLVVDLRPFPDGRYGVRLVLDHVSSHRFHGRFFNHYSKDRNVTYSLVENNLRNEAMLLQAMDPKNSFRLFDSLLTHYPNYLNRRSLFMDALGMYVRVTDSASALSLVDSILVKSPVSHSYQWIARVFAEERFDLPFAQACAETSIARYRDVPENYRKSYQFDNYNVLANVHIASGNDANAEQALEQALSIHTELPPWDRFVMYHVDVDLVKKLGPIKERKGEFLTALEPYKKALSKEPDDAELWSLIQHAYVRLRNSDEGYSEYRDQMQLALRPEKNTINERDTLMGSKFPNFFLHTLTDQEHRLGDFKGKVVVLNFWDFWCGYCLEERIDLEKLYTRHKNRPFAILGIHGRVGLFGHLQNDIAAIEKAMKDYPTSFPTVIETDNSGIASKLGVNAVPTSVVVDKKGVIRFREIGYDKHTTMNRLSEITKKLLSE